MASPISAGEILSVAKFAFDLWQSCKAAKGEFMQVSKEVYAMRTVIELVHLDCQNPSSIINLADNKEKTIRKQLRIHIRNCKQALSEVENLLKRYNKMSLLDRGLWALRGHAEVADLESNLSSFATQLDSFVNGLTLKGVGMVNANLAGGFAKLQKGIGRIEAAIEKNGGDDIAAVKEIMQDIGQSGLSNEQTKKYYGIIDDYAKEVCNMENPAGSHRAKTPDSSRGRDTNPNQLGVPTTPRVRSANTSPGGKQAKNKKGPSLEKSSGKKPKLTLECWLIQIKSTEALFISFQLSEKEKQIRGQWKLEEMAKQFKSCSQTSKLAGDHDLVNWVLEDRRKAEKNSDYTWRPHAAKIEQKNSLYLGLGVEEQAMVIIRRTLTPEALKRADDKKRAAEKKTAAKEQKAEEAKKAAAKEQKAEEAKKAAAKEQKAEEAKKAAAKEQKAEEAKKAATKEQKAEEAKKADAKEQKAEEAKKSSRQNKNQEKGPATKAKRGTNKTPPQVSKDQIEKKPPR